MITLLVMTDGRRECINRAIPSAMANLKGPLDRLVIHDDSGDPDYRDWLRAMWPLFEVIGASTRLGFTGAYANAWRHLAGTDGYVFSTEDDFTFNRPVDLEAMAAVLAENPNVIQTALRRQAWNPQEQAAGGVVEQHPDDYEDTTLIGAGEWHPVLLHRRFFTTNPSLLRAELLCRGWPEVQHSEGIFTHQLIEDPFARFAYWGKRSDDPWVTHIGAQRSGTGY